MHVSRWLLISAVAALLLSGGGFLLSRQGLAGTEIAATGVKRGPVLVREAQAPEAPRPAPAAPAKPHRIETTLHNSWAVTCEDTIVGTATKNTCIAVLRVTAQNQLLLNWQIGLNHEGRFVTAIHVPSELAIKQGDKAVDSPIMVAKGMELKFGNWPARRLSYVWCGPRQCLAEGPIDEAFVKEAVASAKAIITVYTMGGAVAFDVSITGIDKAIASTRR